MSTFKEVWSNCLKIIKDNVPAVSYQTWFEPIVPVRLDSNILTIQVPSPFFYEYLEERYIDILRKTLRKELGPDAKLEYSIVMDNNKVSNSKPFTVKYPAQNKTELKNKPVPFPIQSEGSSIKNPFIIPGLKKLEIDPQLNPDYTFANYVEGECNKLSRSAGYAVAQNPGKTAFNPLFIYGPSGLGKTHLAQAIGIEVKERFSEKLVLYVNANKFQNQYVAAVIKNEVNDFLHFYQMIDVLIIDDVQEFAGKEKTQDTFFHIFNHLHQSGKQLILTSDKAPVDLQGLEQRLLTRFKWGLSADLLLPDLETRVAILKKKIYNDGIVIPEEVIEYLASSITSSIRELEGALISLLAQATLIKREITMDLAAQVVDRFVKENTKELSLDYITKSVCSYFNISSDLLSAKTRKREIVQARQIAMFFCKNLTKSSLSTIGATIGGKDHATVLHAYKTISNLIETDKSFKLQIDEIERKIKF
jgi:chromosomal replication initiator protein